MLPVPVVVVFVVTAFAVWITVRIINRGERWAKNAAFVACVLLPIMYWSLYRMMVVALPPPGQSPLGKVLFPVYVWGDDDKYWQEFFWLAHWVDKKIRPWNWECE